MNGSLKRGVLMMSAMRRLMDKKENHSRFIEGGGDGLYTCWREWLKAACGS
jgi:hypothetical protein